MNPKNTHVSSLTQGEWRVDPDHRQDRKSGSVITYKMTPEEIAVKFRDVKPYERPKIITLNLKGGKRDMTKLNMTQSEIKPDVKQPGQDEASKNKSVKATREVVRRLAAEGKTKEEIFTMLRPVWGGKDSLLIAKIELYLSDKPAGGKRSIIKSIERQEAAESNTMQDPSIPGVGREIPTIENALGGKQSKSYYRFDLMDTQALFALGRVLHEGAEKYGIDNWRKITPEDHINHALIHIYAWLGGDTQDEHLSHAFARIMMALGRIAASSAGAEGGDHA